jgi:protein TonB
MKMMLAAIVLMGSVPAAVQAQEAPASDDLITKPHWLRVQSSKPPWQLYPERAQRRGQMGKARIRCIVSDADVLTDCRVVSEEPTGFGFGEATLRVSTFMRIDHLDGDKRPVEGRPVEISMKFGLR